MGDLVIRDYDGEEVATVNIWHIARSLNPEQFRELLDDFLNSGGKDFPVGKEIGEQMRFTHRTLQRLVVAFCLGVITGISDQEYTDARNETAIETAKKIKQLMDEGELPLGQYI
jgi:hypothetical protein